MLLLSMFQNINYALGLRIAHVIAVLGYPEDVSLDACAVYKALHRPELCFCRNAYDETSTQYDAWLERIVRSILGSTERSSDKTRTHG